MNDVEQQDRKLFISELVRPGRLVLMVALAVLVIAGLRSTVVPLAIFVGLCGIGIWIFTSRSAAIRRRFQNKRFETLWRGCKERLARFEEVLNKMRRDQIADLHEMPKTIRRVGESLYLALRRADLVSNEVLKTEQHVYSAPPVWQASSNDPQAKELYRIADKNIAEYRAQFAGVMAGVQRAEAQSAVFMTTLDTLRMKMISYRLVGRSPEMSSHDFLEALGEAKLQLNAIDQALEELDFTQMPKMVAVVPPPVQTQDLHQG